MSNTRVIRCCLQCFRCELFCRLIARFDNFPFLRTLFADKEAVVISFPLRWEKLTFACMPGCAMKYNVFEVRQPKEQSTVSWLLTKQLAQYLFARTKSKRRKSKKVKRSDKLVKHYTDHIIGIDEFMAFIWNESLFGAFMH